jgi:tetratricopeptide (TPR) repeat protein
MTSERDTQFEKFLNQSYVPLPPYAKYRFRQLGAFMGDLPFSQKLLFTYWQVDWEDEKARDMAHAHLRMLVEAGFIEKTGDLTYCIYGTMAQYAVSLMKRDHIEEYASAQGRYANLILQLVRLLRTMPVEKWLETITQDIDHISAYGDKLVQDWRKGDLDYAQTERITYFLDDVIVFIFSERPPKRLTWLEMGLDLAQKAADIERQGFFLDRISLYHFLNHDLDKALSYLQMALALHQQRNQPRLEAVTLSRIGLLHSEMKNYDMALSRYAESLVLFEQLDDKKNMADVLVNVAQAHYFLGNIPDLRETNIKVIAIYREMDDKPNEAKYNNLMGRTYHQGGTPKDALPYLERARELYHQLEDATNEAGMVSNLALTYELADEFEPARLLYEEAYQAYVTLGNIGKQATALLGIGEAHIKLGEIEKAITPLTQAIPIFRDMTDKSGEIDAISLLNSAYKLLNRHEETLPHYARLLDIFRELGNKADEARTLTNWGISLVMLRRYDQATPMLAQAMQQSLALNETVLVAIAMRHLAIVSLEQGDFVPAIAMLEPLLPLYRQLENRLGEAKTIEMLGLCHASLEQFDEAESYFKQAITAFEVAKDKDSVALMRGYVDKSHVQGQEARYKKAVAHEKKGELAQAIALVEEGLSRSTHGEVHHVSFTAYLSRLKRKRFLYRLIGRYK